jgi:glycosyltransferase involved in cell wall biosynthesis
MSLKTIGVAICAYKGHISHLERLLDSIENQTRKPDHVVVSCSSCTIDDIPYVTDHYTFSLSIYTHSEKRNAAQNRNFAASILKTDIITFFDADDSMHPQRLEIIYNCFSNHDVVIFLHGTVSQEDYLFTHYDSYEYILNKLARCNWGSTILTFYLPNASIANGHVTISREVFESIKFNETHEYLAREDTKFCTDVIVSYPNKTAYCNKILSRYYPSRTGGYEK